MNAVSLSKTAVMLFAYCTYRSCKWYISVSAGISVCHLFLLRVGNLWTSIGDSWQKKLRSRVACRHFGSDMLNAWVDVARHRKLKSMQSCLKDFWRAIKALQTFKDSAQRNYIARFTLSANFTLHLEFEH